MPSRQKVSRLVASAGDSAVRSDREGLALRRSNATLTASAVGTLVNRETASKDARAISRERVCPAMKVEKSVEFLTCESDLPAKGDRIVTRCLKRQYVDDPIKDTIGLSGAPVL